MKSHKRLVSLLVDTFNFSFTEAEGLLRGAEAEAVSRCGGRNTVIRRALRLRQHRAVASLQRRYPAAKDVSVLCMDMGYTGKRRVLVQDGKVVSHGHAEWHAFASRIRTKAAA